jgi:hypothetical protein
MVGLCRKNKMKKEEKKKRDRRRRIKAALVFKVTRVTQRQNK